MFLAGLPCSGRNLSRRTQRHSFTIKTVETPQELLNSNNRLSPSRRNKIAMQAWTLGMLLVHTWCFFIATLFISYCLHPCVLHSLVGYFSGQNSYSQCTPLFGKTSNVCNNGDCQTGNSMGTVIRFENVQFSSPLQCCLSCNHEAARKIFPI